MANWLMGGNMVLKIMGVIFLTLFFINWVCILSSQKIGKISLGDFILMGLLALLIFYNSARLKGLAQCIPDGIGLVVGEVNDKVRPLVNDIVGIKTGINEIFSDVKSLTEGRLGKQLSDGIQYEIPK